MSCAWEVRRQRGSKNFPFCCPPLLLPLFWPPSHMLGGTPVQYSYSCTRPFNVQIARTPLIKWRNLAAMSCMAMSPRTLVKLSTATAVRQPVR